MDWISVKGKRCKSYVGVSCVNGSCPMIDRDECGGYCKPVIQDCGECALYKGCEDCALKDTEHCDKHPLPAPPKED